MGKQSRLREIRKELRGLVATENITAAWANESYRRWKGRTPWTALRGAVHSGASTASEEDVIAVAKRIHALGGTVIDLRGVDDIPEAERFRGADTLT